MTTSRDLPPLTHFGSIFWTNQFRTKIELLDPDHSPSLRGKSAIVSGANTGLGFESSRQLLCLGLSRLIIAVRSIESGNSAATELQKANSAARIDVWELDLESYDSILQFVRKCDEDILRIDYTILNAGVSPVNFRRSRSTRHELTVQVNHISTALLSILLLPLLCRKSTPGAPARMTIVNSLTAHMCKFPNRNIRPLLPSFDDTEVVQWDAQERYGVSKLLNQIFITKMCEHVDRERVIINMVDPGLTKGTRLSRDATGVLRLGARLFFGIAGRPVHRGAATYLNALLVQDQQSHGSFLMNNKIAPLAGILYITEGTIVSDLVWQETLSELEFACVRQILSSVNSK